MSGYTPGPWQVARGHRSGSARAVYPVLRFDSLMRQGHDFEANARLIAAAPELLEALIKMVSVAERDNWQAAISGRQAFLWDAKVAIAKARGEA